MTEKVSVHINSSTLAAIDMLVNNGYYSNRSDFINQALRETLQCNEPNIARCTHGASGSWASWSLCPRTGLASSAGAKWSPSAVTVCFASAGGSAGPAVYSRSGAGCSVTSPSRRSID
ncbi:hypothetical protein [Acutalibacter intestini]|uniref:hypothetical protein n=1 Tax=Acutalibacter intestini TaxID=3093659 RepID=UPI002AC91930|nr:hypothetical protein [Acutalibacter sp. M00204]